MTELTCPYATRTFTDVSVVDLEYIGKYLPDWRLYVWAAECANAKLLTHLSDIRISLQLSCKSREVNGIYWCIYVRHRDVTFTSAFLRTCITRTLEVETLSATTRAEILSALMLLDVLGDLACSI